MVSIDYNELFRVIDSKDAGAFAEFLTPGVVFRFGSNPEVSGREATRDYVAGFYTTLKGLEHTIDRVFKTGDTDFVEGRVTYHLLNGRSVTLPFLNKFVPEGKGISEYRIYVDPTPMAG